MWDSFFNELVKIAIPRWLVEFRKNPKLFAKFFPHVGTPMSVSRIGPAKKDIVRQLRLEKPKVRYRDLPITSPEAQEARFTHKGKHYVVDTEVDPFSRSVISKFVENTKRFLEGKGPPREILNFKIIGSKKMIDIEHYTRNPKSLVSAVNVRTPMAYHSDVPIQTVFTFPKGSPDAQILLKGELSSMGAKPIKKLVSRVPERVVTYGTSTLGTKAVSPEILVPGKEFLKGLI